MPRKPVLLLLTAALALVLGLWTFTPQQAVQVVSKTGYWVILAAVVAFSVTLARSLSDSLPSIRAWRSWLGPAAIAVIGAAFLHLHEPHEFKVVADEVVLSLTAKEMHSARVAAVTVRGYDYAGVYVPMTTYVDKRPLLFPFLLATVHDFTGFRIQNVYWLNGALSVALMGLLLLIGRRIAGWSAGVALVLLVATIPLVAQNACGAGFELLNLVMILLTIWLGMRAAEIPDNDDRLSAFVLSGVLLAQVRYESVLFVVPVAATVVYLWWRQKAPRLPWALLMAPMLMILSPLQLNVFKISGDSWQLGDISGADVPFSLKYFYENVGHALNFFLTTDGSQPNSVLVAVAGTVAVGFYFLLFYRRHREMFSREPANAVLAIFIIGLVAHTFLMLCYFWGHWDDPVIRRLSLPAHLLLVLAIILVWPEFVRGRRQWLILIGVAGVYVMSFTIPSNALHRFTQQNFAARTANWINDYIEGLGDRSALAIDHNAGLVWILNGKSSVTSQAIAGRPEAFLLHFHNRSFYDYLLVQRMTPIVKTGDRIVDADDDFGDALKLETIEERAFAPLYLVRLSRIVGVDDAKLTAWAKSRRSKKRIELPASTSLEQSQENDLLLWLRQLP